MLAAAFVMMVCAAPRIHQVRESSTHDRLASWVWTNPDTPGPWVRVTPASNHGFTRSVWAPVP